VALCNGRVPIPLRCPDCGAYHTLGPHELTARGCHLPDRDSILVLVVRCQACVATRRILPPFVLPRCRYGASAVFGWMFGDVKSGGEPDGTTLARWKRKYFHLIRSGASNDAQSWVRMVRANGKASLVRVFRWPGGEKRCVTAANPTSGSSPASTISTGRLLGTPPRPGSGWPSGGWRM
jgi:hypothetical protein